MCWEGIEWSNGKVSGRFHNTLTDLSLPGRKLDAFAVVNNGRLKLFAAPWSVQGQGPAANVLPLSSTAELATEQGIEGLDFAFDCSRGLAIAKNYITAWAPPSTTRWEPVTHLASSEAR